MRALVVGAILATVPATCASPQGVLFRTTLADPNGEFALPVALDDRTGLVVAIGAAQLEGLDFRDAGVLKDPTAANAVVLTWLGGNRDKAAPCAVVAGPSSW
jgi:hypothetical protein